MMQRHGLTHREWRQLAALLAAQTSRPGRPAKDYRLTTIDALLGLLATGAPWPELPERYGPWRTAAEAGV